MRSAERVAHLDPHTVDLRAAAQLPVEPGHTLVPIVNAEGIGDAVASERTLGQLDLPLANDLDSLDADGSPQPAM